MLLEGKRPHCLIVLVHGEGKRLHDSLFDCASTLRSEIKVYVGLLVNKALILRLINHFLSSFCADARKLILQISFVILTDKWE